MHRGKLKYKSSVVIQGMGGITFNISLSSFMYLVYQKKGLMRDVVRILLFRRVVHFINAELWYARNLPIHIVCYFISAHISALQLA